MKTIEIVNENEIKVDGSVFLRAIETTKGIKANSIEQFKAGNWVIGKEGYVPPYPVKILSIDEDKFTYENTQDVWYNDNMSEEVYIRLATPAEIEAHLKKICDEKYIGKKVKCLFNGDILHCDKFDEFDMGLGIYYLDIEKDEQIKVYDNDKWAEIIPDKKKRPKTKVEFKNFYHAWCTEQNIEGKNKTFIEYINDCED